MTIYCCVYKRLRVPAQTHTLIQSLTHTAFIALSFSQTHSIELSIILMCINMNLRLRLLFFFSQVCISYGTHFYTLCVRVRTARAPISRLVSWIELNQLKWAINRAFSFCHIPLTQLKNKYKYFKVKLNKTVVASIQFSLLRCLLDDALFIVYLDAFLHRLHHTHTASEHLQK